MPEWYRRSMLKAALLGSAAAVSSRDAFAAIDEPAADDVSGLDSASSVDDASSFRSGPAYDPVEFWNDRAVELVVLDHSITVSSPDDVVALGPAASSRALGVIHAVIADAASYAYKPPYKAQFNKTSPGSIKGDRGLFVGGAAYAIMKYIYSPAIFSNSILTAAMSDFMAAAPGSAAQRKATWAAGVRFGKAKAFTALWNEVDVKARLKSDPDAYYSRKPFPERAHMPDPWNCQQGFYGQRWGSIDPLVLTKADVEAVAKNELKAAPAIDQDELDFLIAKGSRVAKDAGKQKARTPEELNVGLFWAYDGTRLVGTPPLLLNEAVRKVSDSDKLDVPATARLLALCHLAMADAAVVAWEAKWRIALWRPVVAIQALTAETEWQPYGSPRTNRGRYLPGVTMSALQDAVDDPAAAEAQDTAETLLGASPAGANSSTGGATPLAARTTPLGAGVRCLSDREYSLAAFTPNFPAYPSGHATFGGACLNSLLLFRSQRGITNLNTVNVTVVSAELDGEARDNYEPSQRRPNVPMTFTGVVQPEPTGAQFDLKTLTGSIDVSRVFLGVHWSFDARDGDTAGRKVGDIVHSRAYAVT